MIRRRKNNNNESVDENTSANININHINNVPVQSVQTKKMQPFFQNNFNNVNNNYDTLVLSGAGTNIFRMLGVLKYFQDEGKLNHIQYYAGTSAGSFLSLCLVFDIDISMIFDELLKVDFETIFSTVNVHHIFTKSSLLSNDVLLNVYNSVISKKLGFIPTLQELFELTKKEWISCVFNYTKYQVEYISHKTHPNLPCTVAAVASSCIPFMFSKTKIDNDEYIDGGVFDNFPIKYMSKLFSNKLKILGIYMFDDVDTKKEESPFMYFLNIFCINRRKKMEKLKSSDFYKENCVLIYPISMTTGFNFSMTYKDKCIAYAEGYKFVKSMV